MSKSARMLAVMTALSLMFPLTGPAAAEPLRMPPELIGSWIGYHKDLCGQFTFFPDERYEMTVFEDPSMDQFGGWSALPRAEGAAFEDGYWYLTMDGETSTFRKTDSPYIREKAGKEMTAASVDPFLIGTFGGKRNNVYVEWTFRGDGSFSQVTPYEHLEENGYFIAGSGEMAILLNGQITGCQYRKSANALILTLPDAENLFFRQKSGKLEQISFDESFDFGWMHTRGTQEPQGYVLARYAGSETVVGIPGTVAMIAVVGIGDEAFKDNKSLRSITLPPWTQWLGESTFAGCKSLTEILLTKTGGDETPDEPGAGEDYLLKTIGDNAFHGCTSLASLNIATDALPSLHSPFWWIGRSVLAGVNIPSGVTTIGAHAFDGCAGIQSVRLPASVKSIGEGAFDNCPHLTLKVLEGSYAQRYAQDNAIPFEIAGN